MIVGREDEFKWSSFNSYIGRKSAILGLNTKYVLEIFAKNHQRAIELFKEFSRQDSIESFIEIKEEDNKVEKEIKGVLASSKKVEEILKIKGIKLECLGMKPFKVLRNEIIMIIKDKTDLSIRQIAEMLKINRGIVERIK